MARHLGLGFSAITLSKETLAGEKRTDKKLTKIAAEGGNQAATLQ